MTPLRSAAVGVFVLLTACASPRPSTFRVVHEQCQPCQLEKLAEQLSGAGAEDCGWARAEGDRSRLQSCVLQAAGKGKPFRALMTLPGIDSVVVAGYVRTPVGEISQLWFDSSPSGSPGTCRGLVTRTTCTRLAADPKGQGKLLCEGRGEQSVLCDEQARRTEEGSGVEDARLLACNPVPREGQRGHCLRLQKPEGNVPEGMSLTCQPFSSAPVFLLCDTGGEVQTLRR